MTDAELEFVESMGAFLAQAGLPRMAGRMFGYLLISDPPQQTAGELADALQASRGSISGTARFLTHAGLVRRSTRRGERREYFEVPPGGISELLRSAARQYDAFASLAERGIHALAERPPEHRRRLEELRDVYRFFAREYPALLERMERERKDSVA